MPKSFTDRRDLAVLLLQFPELKSATGAVAERLLANSADQQAIGEWEDICKQAIIATNEDDGY